MMHNELNFDDIFDVWSPAWWESPWVWCAIGAGIIACIGLIFLITYYYRLYKTKKQKPLDVALQKIFALKKAVHKERANDAGMFQGKEFYVELSQIMKHYLDGAYGLQTESKTDCEFYQYLKTCDISKVPEIAGWVSSAYFLIERGTCIKFGRELSDYSIFLNECEKVHNILIKTSQREKQA